MRIRNLTAKPIGFGGVVILPDQTGETPKGYDKSHPTVKYYLSRRWIVETGAIGGATVSQPAGLTVSINAGGSAGADDDENGGGENTNTGSPGATGSPAVENKSLDRMNKDELQALAFARNIVFAETDTRQALIDKIKAVKNADA
jgi:hypothetical protein